MKSSNKLDRERNQISALIYYPAKRATAQEYGVKAYFNGRFVAGLTSGVIPALNAEWVDHVFDPTFIGLVKKGAKKW